MDPNDFNEQKEKTRRIYDSHKTIYNPFFNQEIILNSDGFHHLQFSDRHERDKNEQLLKFSLLPLAIKVIKKSGTIQEYRKCLMEIGKKSKRDGFTLIKTVQYWGFIAIVGKKQIKIRVIMRRVGDGNIIFWSVMPDSKLKHSHPQKLYTDNIEDE